MHKADFAGAFSVGVRFVSAGYSKQHGDLHNLRKASGQLLRAQFCPTSRAGLLKVLLPEGLRLWELASCS